MYCYLQQDVFVSIKMALPLWAVVPRRIQLCLYVKHSPGHYRHLENLRTDSLLE